eukprot:3277171-Pyramimonas_sp.AAC.2
MASGFQRNASSRLIARLILGSLVISIVRPSIVRPSRGPVGRPLGMSWRLLGSSGGQLRLLGPRNARSVNHSAAI